MPRTDVVRLESTVTDALVSVIIPVFNGATDLPRSINSILAQTFTDLELIVVDDGSTDATAEVLKACSDPRLRVVRQDNQGVARAANSGIALARGRFIARLDHDDLAKPTRIERQVAFMRSHPDCALVGTRAEIWIGDRPSGRAHDHPTDDAALRFEMMFDNPFVHSSTMMRRAALEDVGLYCTDPNRQPPEDYELFCRLARRYRVANLPERLTIYREIPTSLSRAGQNPLYRQRLAAISAGSLAAAVGLALPNVDHRDIAALTHRSYRQVSAGARIDVLCAVVEDAGARIHAAAPGSDVPARVAMRLRRLRVEYHLLRSGLYRVPRLAGLMRRMLSGRILRGRPASGVTL
jgi:glycosyltransferase involved in cell wall biosynthesis